MPSATILRDNKNKELPVNYFEGIPIGRYEQDFDAFPRIVIYNHLEIKVVTHTTNEGSQRIVGFEVEPFSMAEGPHRSLNDPSYSDGDQFLETD